MRLPLTGESQITECSSCMWGAVSVEFACKIQTNVLAGTIGLPYFDIYLYSQKVSYLNSSFHHDLIFICSVS
jgi:hypothetical protein